MTKWENKSLDEKITSLRNTLMLIIVWLSFISVIAILALGKV